MKYLFILLMFTTSLFSMPIYEVTGNITFDYFFSLNTNIGLILFGFTAVLRLLR
ncbi:hypothetical protein [Arcobacter arenosus]|uniref:hypothetical protein n=1 Tax=Arcobacter arenosus TaxID=2576037 RepID=UPI001485398E|nr:hypothetical protein [Arcobacter arenosus]